MPKQKTITNKGLYEKDSIKFKFKRAWKALCEPQPGQSHPVIFLKGQNSNAFSLLGSIK